MDSLPIDSALAEIVDRVHENGALVLTAPPGAGKTTRVPPALLSRCLEPSQHIVLLQPRRIAARVAAARIAVENEWKLGQEVGYVVRYENRVRAETRIHVVTEGVLIRRLQSDPFLSRVGVVIFDEFHERSLHTDFALALLADIRRSARPDLAVVVMSATLDPQPVARFLGNAPVIEVEGRSYPVALEYMRQRDDLSLHERVARCVESTWNAGRGHTLVFLPGVGEIHRTARNLEGFGTRTGTSIQPLHGSLSLPDQQAALAPSERRKVILATNVAETSLTIEGVDTVVDSGFARVLRQDARHGINRLETTRISCHSADQRAGRAGRLGPGRAFRLWTQSDQNALRSAEDPEIQRVDLASTLLELRAWGIARNQEFGWFEPPSARSLEQAESLLIALGALDASSSTMTNLGQEMLTLPTHPRVARLLLSGRKASRTDDAALLAALIEERDIVPKAVEPTQSDATEVGPSDLLQRRDLFEELERGGFHDSKSRSLGVDRFAARAVARTRDVLRRMMKQSPAQSSSTATAASDFGENSLLRMLLAAYPDRVIRRRERGSRRGVMVGGRGVTICPSSVVTESELLVAVELREPDRTGATDAVVTIASAIKRDWILDEYAAWITERSECWYDEKTERVRSTRALCYHDLALESPRETHPNAEVAAHKLAEVVRPRAEEIFLRSPKAWEWIVRARCLADWVPDLQLPAVDADALGELLAAACSGKTALADFSENELFRLTSGTASHGERANLDRQAPETLQVPSGSNVRLTYELGKPPVLAVRLQELFGLAETPTVAGGRIPVLLHILAPNFRPVQVTQDLRNFWNKTYAHVRKELRGRYPKHSWPEDPWKAQATRGARRKR